MSGIIFTDAVTHVPADWANAVNRLVYSVFGAASTKEHALLALGIGSLGLQSSSNVSIGGGLINDVTIGEITPAANIVTNYLTVLNAPITPQGVPNKAWVENYVNGYTSSQVLAAFANLGSIATQNKNNVNITGGTLDNTDIGLGGRGSAAFTTAKASNPPVDGDDLVTLGWLNANYDSRLSNLRSMAYQNHDAVAVTGGTINGVSLGATTAVTANISTGNLTTVGSQNTSLVNRGFVTAELAEALNNFGTMAVQNANAVAIVGGMLNGVTIGATAPGTAKFTDASVSANKAWLTVSTTNSAAESLAGVKWASGGSTVASLKYVGANNTAPNNRMELNTSIPLVIQNENDSLISLSGTSLVVDAPIVSLIPTAFHKLVIGGGTPQPGFSTTVNRKIWVDQLTTDRAQLGQGYTQNYDDNHAVAATGNITLSNANSSAAVVRLTGNTIISFSAPDTTWTGLREYRLLVKQTIGGHLVQYPGNVLWNGVTPPNYAGCSANDFDMVRLWTVDGGVTWYGESSYSLLNPVSIFFTSV